MSYRKPCLSTLGILIMALSLIAASSGSPNNQPQHCYALVSPITENSNIISQILETACFDTFAEAINAATAGRVQLDPSTRPGEVTNDLLNPVDGSISPMTQVVIGIDWDSTNFIGNSFTWVANDYGCSSTIQYGVPTMPSGWDNRVSSARGYSNCNYFYHYQNTNYSGTSIACHTDCSSMGTLDKATSSERWTFTP